MNSPIEDNKQDEKEDFRNSLATADQHGKRKWVFARKVKGRFARWRSLLSFIQIGVLLLAPFLKVGGAPLVLIDIFERRFVFFGKTFWPQDFFIFAIGMIAFFVAIAAFTAIWGRVFCGWACPQTVFLEGLFRKIEFLILGDGPRQRSDSRKPLKGVLLYKRMTKHLVFFVVSYLIGNVFLAYIVGGDRLLKLISDGPQQHLGLFFAILAFTLVFFWHFTWFREQFCTFLCPYARLQSVLLDDNSIVVAYDEQRGEGVDGRANKSLQRKNPEKKFGDCVDCGLCVQVCPTGIDIRNGFPQLECVNCTACIDACDRIMKKNDKKPGLIRYASRNMLEKKEDFRFTPRIATYSFILLILSSFLTFLVLSRTDTDTTITRLRGSLPRVEGKSVMNVYQAKIINKTNRDLPLTLQASQPLGATIEPQVDYTLKANSMETLTFWIRVPDNGAAGTVPAKIGLYENGQLLEESETTFMWHKIR